MEKDLSVDLDSGLSNPYSPLMPDARSTLRQLMLNSGSEKIRVSVAESILDRGGEAKKLEQRVAPNIVIKDSQVLLLVKAAQEALE